MCLVLFSHFFLPIIRVFVICSTSLSPQHLILLFDMAAEVKPLFRAVSTSPRPLYQLLRCIDFAQRVHVQITEDGIRFAADNSRVMQGAMAAVSESVAGKC